MRSQTDMNEVERAMRRLLEEEGASRRAKAGDEQPSIPGANEDEAAKVRRVWNELGSLQSHPEYEDLLGAPTARERIVAAFQGLRSFAPAPVLAAAAAVAAITVAILVRAPSQAPTSEHFSTQVAETRDVVLQDGTHVALGPKSAMEVTFTAGERRVSVMPGESYFEVAPNAKRPFVVTAGNTRITVVGTKFNVKYDNNVVRVSVVEGLVNVLPTSAPGAQAASVAAGNEATVSRAAQYAVVEPIDLSSPPDSWRTGQLYYDDVSLDEIVFDLNRHLAGQVRIDSVNLGQARLTTSFSTEQAVQFLEGLPNLLPVEIRRPTENEFVLTDATAQ
jgi:transmembrane sensor